MIVGSFAIQLWPHFIDACLFLFYMNPALPFVPEEGTLEGVVAPYLGNVAAAPQQEPIAVDEPPVVFNPEVFTHIEYLQKRLEQLQRSYSKYHISDLQGPIF
jgi:hypothetical protein